MSRADSRPPGRLKSVIENISCDAIGIIFNIWLKTWLPPRSNYRHKLLSLVSEIEKTQYQFTLHKLRFKRGAGIESRSPGHPTIPRAYHRVDRGGCSYPWVHALLLRAPCGCFLGPLGPDSFERPFGSPRSGCGCHQDLRWHNFRQTGFLAV